MPYTEKQRRYFHAAAERGEAGMSGLASEADSLAKAGKERAPVKEHVEKYEHGGMVCRHCGAEVAEDGYATTLHMSDESPGEERAETEQHEATERMRDAAFGDALKRRAGR